ncbi:alpha-2-macroglobulin, partial [bacterium]|nr:alpha-2-macroglobulin [bacterium]
MKKIFILVFFILGLFASTGFTLKQEEREVSHKLYNEGNYKDAYEGFRRLSLNPQDTPQEAQEVSNDLNMAIACLNQLNRLEEIDEFREMVIGIHKDNWRLLYAAAQSYFNGSHYGYIIAGKFERGGHRGGGHYVNSFERDRIRALQLMTEAMQIEKDSNGGEQAGFYLEFSHILIGYRGYKEAWRLQYLSDFSQLPDYEEGYGYNYNKTTSGAAVNPNGTPVFHKLPKTYKDAQSDGERWRWMLIEAIELNPDIENQVLMDYANFLQEQFDVQTMGYLGRLQDEDKNESTTYCLDTLAENETIARLAIGIKRFSLPDEFNFIKIYQKIADNTQERHCAEEALNKLANIFENRRQFDKAVHCLNRSIKEHGSGDYKQKRIDQILGNWGEFEPIMTHPAGKEATVEYRFRNGTKVSFQAHEIHIKELLDDAKTYLKSNPRELKWDCGTVNISNIGYRLVMKEGTKYLGQKVAEWGIRLEPRKMHFDKRVTIKTPLKKAGAYLLTATMSDGNTSKIIIWIDDTVILKKNLDKGAYFFVADAVSGKPLPNVNVEFFGYRREPVKRKEVGRDWNILTNDSAEFTDENGQVILTSKDFDSSHHWMIIATTESGRLAYLGFCGIWYSNYYDHEYNQVKVFSITDRPVYRPNQPVRFKFWVNHARYDQEDRSSFANTSFYLCINNPKGEKVFGKQFTTDSYGGFDGEYCLPKDATLGVYSIYILGYGDGGTFRVEEYKKPEFEVKVETPKEPVMLGEKITVSIKAGYYFGQPVTKAKARYKVLRSDYKANWYPTGIWDWFYGPG